MFIQPDKYQVHTKVQALIPAYANILGSENIAEQSQYIQMHREDPSLCWVVTICKDQPFLK
jgi:hypothetical protein